MIVSRDGRRVISSLGWADSAMLWVLDVATRRISHVPIAEDGHVRLRPGLDGYFTVAHHAPEGGLTEVSVRHVDVPEAQLVSLRLVGGIPVLAGDSALWERVPKGHCVGTTGNGKDAVGLVAFVANDGQAADVQRVEWFNAAAYDFMYQALGEPVAIPGTSNVLFPVQRSSTLVCYSVSDREVIRRIDLADRYGNPSLRFRAEGAELWATDYDTLVRLDPTTWSIVDQVLLQPPAEEGRQFIGNFAFSRDEALCVVARPFAGDVVALDSKTLGIVSGASTGRQPLEAVLLDDGLVIARDWQSGDLVTGELKPLRRRLWQRWRAGRLH